MKSKTLAFSLSAPLMMEKAFMAVPDSWQARFLSAKPNRGLLLCSRQAGKSTVCSVLALHKAVFTSSSLTLIVSKSLRQAEELFRKIKVGLPEGLCSTEIVRENQSSLELSNGSRIISLPAKPDTVRSYSSVSLMIIDEAAQVEDELYSTLRPMLAVSKGSLVAVSTPFGKRGWFYNAWVNESGWDKIKITAKECPRITESFLKEELKSVGEWWVKQEYFCEFVDTESQLFGTDIVLEAISSEVTSWDVAAL